MDIITSTFPYMVDASKATGGGDIPSFTYNIIEHDKEFFVEGVKFTPLPGKEKRWSIASDTTFASLSLTND